MTELSKSEKEIYDLRREKVEKLKRTESFPTYFKNTSFISDIHANHQSLDNGQEDLENVGAEDYHQLMRAWELKHRTLTSQCVTEHTLYREETRWPGYYYRGDHMKLDDENWHCLTVSRRDPETGKFTMEKKPVYHIVDDKEKKKAS